MLHCAVFFRDKNIHEMHGTELFSLIFIEKKPGLEPDVWEGWNEDSGDLKSSFSYLTPWPPTTLTPHSTRHPLA